MKTKRSLKRALCCILALLLLTGSVHGLSLLLGNKNSVSHFKMFYESETDFDILFMGSSHMLNAAIPMQIWNDYGFTSYNLAYGSCRMAYSYWLLKSALEHCTPKLVVMDCAYINEDVKTSDASRPNHMLFNAMPLGRTKLEALWDLYETRSDRMRYLFPLTEFHRRWNDIGMDDFRIVPDIMGQDLHFEAEKASINCAPRDDSALVDTVSVQYLEMIIQECKDRGIDVLLCYIPFQAGEQSMNDMAALYSMAESWGLNYIDPYTMLEFLDPQTDYFNSYENNSHLNFSGASKFSDYIARYIAEHYDMPDRRSDPDYAIWNKYYSDYLIWLDEKLSASSLALSD